MEGQVLWTRLRGCWVRSGLRTPRVNSSGLEADHGIQCVVDTGSVFSDTDLHLSLHFISIFRIASNLFIEIFFPTEAEDTEKIRIRGSGFGEMIRILIQNYLWYKFVWGSKKRINILYRTRILNFARFLSAGRVSKIFSNMIDWCTALRGVRYGTSIGAVPTTSDSSRWFNCKKSPRI